MPETSKIDQIQERSEYAEELLGATPPLIMRAGVYFFFVFIGLILFLAYLIRYPDVLIARATIVNQNPTVSVVVPSTGRLERFLVKDRELVKENQPLALIQSSAQLEDMLQLELYVDKLESALEMPDSALPEIPRAMELGNLQSSYTYLQQEIQRINLYQQLDDVEATIAGLKKQIAQYQNMNGVLKNQASSLSEEKELVESSRQRNTTLFEEGVISEADFEQAKTTFLRFQREIGTVDMNIANNRVRIEQLRGQILELQQQDREFVRNKRIEITEQARSLRSQIEAWKQAFLIRAPIAGKITLHQNWSEKQFVTANSELLVILPEGNQQTYARVSMPEQNSGKVQLGNRVMLKLDGFNYREFGVLEGSVDKISLTPRRGFYTIDVALPNGTETSFNKTLNFDQDVQANAEIVVEELSLLDRIFYTLRSAILN